MKATPSATPMDSQPAAMPPSTTEPEVTSPPSPAFPNAILFLVWFIVLVTATLITYVLPESFRSSARIRVEQDDPSIERPTYFQAPGRDLFFVQTEIGVIQSEAVLTNVVHRLDLNREWGRKYMPGGKALRTEESVSRLKMMVDVHQVPNTTFSFIDVGVYADQPEEAARLANAVAEAYRDYRISERRQLQSGGMEALMKLYNEQSEKVRQAQQVVNELRKTSETGSQLEEAKRELDEALRLRTTINMKVVSPRMDSTFPPTTIVEIIEYATPVYKAAQPNKPFNILLGILVGGLAGLVVATSVHLFRAYTRTSQRR